MEQDIRICWTIAEHEIRDDQVGLAVSIEMLEGHPRAVAEGQQSPCSVTVVVRQV
jgi:hypothetical protein